MLEQDETRPFYEKLIGKPIPDDVWRFAECHFGVSEPFAGFDKNQRLEEIGVVVGTIQELMNLKGTPRENRRGHFPPRRTDDYDVDYLPTERVVIRAVSDYVAKHAALLPEVRDFRERTLGGASMTSSEIDRWEALGRREHRENLVQMAQTSTWPKPRLLSEEEAKALLRSDAARRLSLEQFGQWGIPVVGHASAVEYEKRPDDDGCLVDLRITPPGEVFRLSSSEHHIDIGGFVKLPGWERLVKHANERAPANFHEAALLVFHGGAETGAPLSPEDLALLKKLLPRYRFKKTCIAIERRSQTRFENTLVCRSPKRPEPDRIRVWPGSILDDLRAISGRLAESYQWSEADAAWFVLTGVRPWVQALVTQTLSGPAMLFGGEVSVKTLPAVSRKTVSKTYHQLSSRLHRQARPLAPRTLEVFCFVTAEEGACVRPEGINWRALSKKWRAIHPCQKDAGPAGSDEQPPGSLHLRQSYTRAIKNLGLDVLDALLTAA